MVRLDVLDIALDLAACSSANADDPVVITSLDERDVIEDVGLGCEGDHAQLVVAEAIVDPDKCGIPIEFARQPQRDPVSRAVQRILRRIELDSHALL